MYATGKIKFFDSAKGWGFVIDEKSKKEYFVHWKNIENSEVDDNGHKVLYEKDFVEYEPTEADGKLIAKKVRLI